MTTTITTLTARHTRRPPRRLRAIVPLGLATATALAVVLLPGSPATATASAPTTATSTARTTATQVGVIRPVTASGRPAPGWAVTRESGSVDCDGTALSATDPGIAACYPTAYSLRACWKSARHTVLCLRDPASQELARIRYAGTYPAVEPVADPTPVTFDLGDGRSCLQRVGGAWGSPRQHRQWVGFDSCTGRADVYGPGEGDGIDRSADLWTAKLWRYGPDPLGRHLVTRPVTAAYLVGTAA